MNDITILPAINSVDIARIHHICHRIAHAADPSNFNNYRARAQEK